MISRLHRPASYDGTECRHIREAPKNPRKNLYKHMKKQDIF